MKKISRKSLPLQC